MEARRFWRRIRHKLLLANVVVYGSAVVLVVVFHRDLMWAQRLVRGHLSTGEFDSPADLLLVKEATESLKAGGDVERARMLVERAVKIEPYGKAWLLLGDCYAMQGDEDKMLECYGRYRETDPCVIGVYGKMCAVLRRRGDLEAMRLLVEDGIRHFRRRVELYKPHYDASVREEFNRKAFDTYEAAQDGLKLLEKWREEVEVLR